MSVREVVAVVVDSAIRVIDCASGAELGTTPKDVSLKFLPESSVAVGCGGHAGHGYGSLSHAGMLAVLDAARPVLRFYSVDGPIHNLRNFSLLDRGSALAVSTDGALVAVGAVSGAISLWSLGTGALLRTFNPGRGGVSHLEFTTDCAYLFAATSSGTCLVYNVAELASVCTTRILKDWRDRPSSFFSGGDNKPKAAEEADDSTHHILEAHTNEFVDPLVEFRRHDGGLTSALITSGEYAITGDTRGNLHIWSLVSGKVLGAVFFGKHIAGLAYSTLDHLAVCLVDGVGAGTCSIVMISVSQTIRSCRERISGGHQGPLIMSDEEPYITLVQESAHDGRHISLRFSTGSNLLIVTDGAQRQITMWDVASRQLVRALPFDTSPALPKAATTAASASVRVMAYMQSPTGDDANVDVAAGLAEGMLGRRMHLAQRTLGITPASHALSWTQPPLVNTGPGSPAEKLARRQLEYMVDRVTLSEDVQLSLMEQSEYVERSFDGLWNHYREEALLEKRFERESERLKELTEANEKLLDLFIRKTRDVRQCRPRIGLLHASETQDLSSRLRDLQSPTDNPSCFDGAEALVRQIAEAVSASAREKPLPPDQCYVKFLLAQPSNYVQAPRRWAKYGDAS